MAEFVDLNALLAHGRVADAALAWRTGRTLDFSWFASTAAAWRDAFAGVAGERVALYFEDSAEFAAALFGAWHAGKQAVLPADVLPDTRHRLRTLVAAVAGDFPVDAALPRLHAGALANATAPWTMLDPGAIAVHVFTSGSTGAPTLIAKTIAQLCAETRALDAAFAARIGRGCVHASVTHQHLYGLAFRLLWPLAAGRPFAATRLQFPEDLAAALAATPDAVLITSPAQLKRLPEQIDWARARSHLSAVFSSGGPLPETALPLCARVLGRVPIEIYGSSETGAVAWRERRAALDAPWQPLPGLELRIAEQQMELRAPWIAGSDWQRSADRVAARDGGFDLLGRGDRIVKIEEKRVSLQGIEHTLAASGLVAEVRALVLSGERERIGVVVVPSEAGWQRHDREGRRALANALRNLLVGTLETVVLPRHWRFPWALPTNATGKTSEAALSRLFDPRRPHARLLEHGADAATLRIEVAASSPFFDGHFAGAPILPGVTQIDWVIRFARELFALPAEFARIEHLKFHDWIGAGTEITLTLERAGADGIGFRIASAERAHASGRVRFAVAP